MTSEKYNLIAESCLSHICPLPKAYMQINTHGAAQPLSRAQILVASSTCGMEKNILPSPYKCPTL